MTEQTRQKRAHLVVLSQGAKMAVKMGAYDSVNEALLAMYRGDNPGVIFFKTFQQWKKEGFMVKKGEKAFLIWGAPRKINKKKENSTTETPETTEQPANLSGTSSKKSFYPVCYLFSNLQVQGA